MDVPAHPSDPIPAQRLGVLLRSARRETRTTRRDLARRLAVPAATVRSWETGVTRPGPEAVDAVAAALGITLDDLIPPRTPLAADAAVGADRVEALVGLVASLRQTAGGGVLRLRRAELDMLAAALGADVGDVEARIAQLTSCTPAEAAHIHRQLTRGRFALPLAVSALGVVGMGTAVAPTAGASGPPAPPAAAVAHPGPDGAHRA